MPVTITGPKIDGQHASDLYGTHALAEVVFHTKEFGAIFVTQPPRRQQVPVLSFTTTKLLQSPPYAGQWSMELIWPADFASLYPDKDWLDVLSEDDWVLITVVSDGRYRHLWLGMIDSIHRTQSVSANGARLTRYSVYGRDFAKVIDDTVVWLNPWGGLANIQGMKAFRMFSLENNLTLNHPPDVVCKALVKALLRAESGDEGFFQWELPDSLVTDFGVQSSRGSRTQPLAGDIIDVDSSVVTNLRGEGWAQQALMPETFSLGQELSGWSNSILNELFFDFRPTDASNDQPRPVMVMREKPFPVGIYTRTAKKAKRTGTDTPERAGPMTGWDKLRKVVIERSRVRSENVVKSGDDRVNSVMVFSTTDHRSISVQYLAYPPVFNGDSIKQHGLHKFETETRYHAPTQEIVRNVELKRWAYLLSAWHGPAADLLHGVIELAGFYPDIRVGTKLQIGNNDDPLRETFYVEGVQVAWQFPQGAQTSVQLSRGYKGADDNLYRVVKNYMRGVVRDSRSDSFIETGAIPVETEEGVAFA